MAKGIKICKVCGKEYPYCKTQAPTGKFRYQDVACSPECGTIYFERILASREKNIETDDEPTEVDSVVDESEIEEKEGIVADNIVTDEEEEVYDGDENND